MPFMEPEGRVLVVDTDAGVDDAFALVAAMAGLSSHTLIAVTTCFGNVNVEQATLNAAWLVHNFSPGDVPVYKGCPSKLISCNDEFEDQHCWKGHGPKGMGNLDIESKDPEHLRFFKPTSATELQELVPEEHASSALARLAKQYSGRIDVVALGPLTNIALAVKLSPSFVKDLNSLVVMGGCTRARGNANFCAEFNFWSDPEAAHIVLESFSAQILKIVPWELTEMSGVSWETFDEFCSQPTASSYFLSKSCELFAHYFRSPTTVFTLCDVYALFVLLDPSIVTVEEVHHCVIETQGKHTRGMLSFDWYSRSGNPLNATVVHSISVDKYIDMFSSVLRSM